MCPAGSPGRRHHAPCQPHASSGHGAHHPQAGAADLINSLAASLSGQRYRELLAAINTELLKAALVTGTTTADEGRRSSTAVVEGGTWRHRCTPEGLLVASLKAVQRVQGEAYSTITAEAAAAWEAAIWDMYHVEATWVGHTLFDLQKLAADHVRRRPCRWAG